MRGNASRAAATRRVVPFGCGTRSRSAGPWPRWIPRILVARPPAQDSSMLFTDGVLARADELISQLSEAERESHRDRKGTVGDQDRARLRRVVAQAVGQRTPATGNPASPSGPRSSRPRVVVRVAVESSRGCWPIRTFRPWATARRGCGRSSCGHGVRKSRAVVGPLDRRAIPKPATKRVFAYRSRTEAPPARSPNCP